MFLPKQQSYYVYGPYPRPDPQSPALPFLLLETSPLIPVEEEHVMSISTQVGRGSTHVTAKCDQRKLQGGSLPH